MLRMSPDLGAVGYFFCFREPDFELGTDTPPESVVPNPDNGLGAIAIVASAPNAPACNGQSRACNGGCNPTNLPGYSVTTTNNLLGSITHQQEVIQPSGNMTDPILSRISGITETPLSDDAGGDPVNLICRSNAARSSAMARAVESVTVRPRAKFPLPEIAFRPRRERISK